MAKVMAVAPPGMIAMPMGNHRPLYGHPRIYVNVSLRAVDTPIRKLQHGSREKFMTYRQYPYHDEDEFNGVRAKNTLKKML